MELYQLNETVSLLIASPWYLVCCLLGAKLKRSTITTLESLKLFCTARGAFSFYVLNVVSFSNM
ncbi:hypothetical protein X975_26795, partial [Stegodyphus mimosarum]